jgi:hypothetical protein
VTMASLALPSVIAVILESKPMEQKSLKLATPLQQSTAEEVQ